MIVRPIKIHLMTAIFVIWNQGIVEWALIVNNLDNTPFELSDLTLKPEYLLVRS